MVEGDLFDLGDGEGEVGEGLGGGVVAPGADGVEVVEQLGAALEGGVGGEAGGEGLAVELSGEAVGEVLEQGERDQEGVARGPGPGGVAEDAELDRQVRALGGDGLVDAAGVELQPVELVGREVEDGAIGGGAEAEDALDAVGGDEVGAEDLGELAGGVAADGVHLEEAIAGGDEALGEDEVIDGAGVEVGDALRVAGDGDGRGEAGEREAAVDLREGVAGGVAEPDAAGEEAGEAKGAAGRGWVLSWVLGGGRLAVRNGGGFVVGGRGHFRSLADLGGVARGEGFGRLGGWVLGTHAGTVECKSGRDGDDGAGGDGTGMLGSPSGAWLRKGPGRRWVTPGKRVIEGGGAMTGGYGVQAVQTVFLLLLLMVAGFAVVARRLRVPYPIVLVMAGLLISFVPHLPAIRLNSDLVFLIFLPPLLYASAWQTSWREFRGNLLAIALLAFGLVGFTVWGVAEVADRFITSLDWKSGLVLGAVVATTDAIAAASIASSIGLPKRIVELLEGESLVNDATGLLALEFGLQIMVRGESPTVGAGVLRMLWLIGGGLGAGLVLGVLTAWVERWVDDGPVEMVISVIVPYAAYLAGEEMHASGVLAVVACGLYVSRRSVTFFSPEARMQVGAGWGALNFALNGIVFALIGLQLPFVMAGIREYSWWTLLEYGAVFSAVLIVLRMVWVYPAAGLAYWVRTRWWGPRAPRPGASSICVVGWTGMRGVLSLAAAISLPEMLGPGRPFAQRNLIVFLAFSVILVTLVVQGLSLPALIRALGLAGKEGASEEEIEARRAAIEAAMAYLEQGRAESGPALDHGYEDLLHRYRHRLEAVLAVEEAGDPGPEAAELSGRERLREVAREAVEVERQVLIRLRDSGRIGDEVQRRLERELDLTEARQRAGLPGRG